MFGAITWADVVHYHYGGAYVLPYKLDIKYLRALRKPKVITFWGSDVRIPEIESAHNPYFARRGPSYEYEASENYAHSRATQSYYARRGFTCVVGSETVSPYILKDLFPHFHLIRSCVDTNSIQPRYPHAYTRRPLVVHSPSAPIAKGTPAVLRAIATLKETSHLDFEFTLVQNMPHEEALNYIGSADIFLDQFLLGGYGVAAVEAMAMGKPTVCYISPAMAALFPPDLPVVQATQDNLADILAALIRNGQTRHELGLRSRAYAEQYHDAQKVARQLAQLYEELCFGRGTL